MEIYIPVLVALLLGSAFFSSAETAFLSLEGVRLEHQRRGGVPGAERVAALLARPRRLLAAILLGNNLVNTGAAAVGTVIAAEIVDGGVGVLLATLVMTLLLVIFGEVAPKTMALYHNLSLARAYALPLQGWSLVARPMVAGLEVLSRTLLRLVGEGAEHMASLSLGELRTAIRLTAETGDLARGESSMLLGALQLQQTQVRRIMTPRVRIIAVDVAERIGATAGQVSRSGFLRLPVSAEAPDNIVGYVHSSDVLEALNNGRGDEPVREVMRDALFESERASVQQVLDQMRSRREHLAILIDEFGTTAGLVTLEDILELVVGEIPSESGPQQSEVVLRIGGRLFVEGTRPVADLAAELDLELEDEEAETVAGLILTRLRRIPQRGESVELAGYRLTVMGADERRISLVAVEQLDRGSEVSASDAEVGAGAGEN